MCDDKSHGQRLGGGRRQRDVWMFEIPVFVLGVIWRLSRTVILLREMSECYAARTEYIAGHAFTSNCTQCVLQCYMSSVLSEFVDIDICGRVVVS